VLNSGPAVGRNLAVVLAGMPAGVTFPNASGTDSSGNPYVSMHDAIPVGGLATGALSSPVAITLSDPALTRFALTAQVLGGPEVVPSLQPIGPLTAMPGQVLTVPLSATNPSGDPITFTLQSSGPLPTSTLEPGGTLLITPAPSDLGTFHFNVVASTGTLQATQPVTLTVTADTNTDTRISGVVEATTGAVLPGVTITVDSVQVTTGSDGSFLVDFPANPPASSDRLAVKGITFSGQTYPSVAEVLSLLLGHNVYDGVNNVISRPIFLPALNLAQGAMVNPAQNTTVAPAALPGASLFVQAGTLLTPGGQPYSGILSVTQVPVDQTPAALPANLKPSVVVTIQPGGMTFTTPAPITLPNPGYAPGTIMDLWSISAATGMFAIAGEGQVSADGTEINTISGGIHNSSWHFFAPPPPPPPPSPPDFGDGPPCDDSGGGPGDPVNLYNGDVHDTVNLASYQSLGTANTLQLHYDSNNAYPQPIVRVGYDSIDTRSFTTFNNVVLMARLTVQEGASTYVAPGYTGTGIPGLTGGEQFSSVPTTGGSAYATFQVDMQNLPTGVYDDTALTGFFGFSSTTHFAVAGSYATTNGHIFLVNDTASPFGAGWDLAGLETLYPSADGTVMLVDGGGQGTSFQPPATPGGAYVSQPGDFSTLVKLSDGTFQRTLTDGTIDHFNSSNQLATVTDRNGNVTTYAYDASGRLLSITDPVGLVTTVSYTGSHVTSITDPAGRITQLAYDAAGNLMTLTNPDGSHSAYQYDAQHHLIGETDPDGNQSHDRYDAFGRASTLIRKDGSVVTFNPVQVQGLQSPGGPFSPFTAPPAGTNVASYTDGNGHVTDLILNYAGQIVSRADGQGTSSTAQLDANFLPTSVTNGNGYETLYTYDSHGNVTTTQYQFSGNISGQIFNPGDTNIYTFTATPGQTFFYDGLTTSFIGINARLLDPAGNQVVNINASNNSGLVTLEAAGTYQLIIAGNGATTGTYSFHLYTPTVTTTPLAFNTPVTNTIANPGDQFAYTFEGTPGERIFYNPSTTFMGNQQAELFDPFGNVVYNINWSSPQGPTVLTQTGAYTLLLFGNGATTGTFNFVVSNPVRTTATLTFNTPVTGTINPGDQAAYTFSGAPGQQIDYDATTPSMGGQQVQLFDPFGNAVFNSNWSNDQGPLTLTQTGTYTLLLSGNGAATGTYGFQVLNAADQAALTLGTTTSGTLNPGTSTAIYRVSGTAGQRLLFHSLAAGNASWILYDPGNALVPGALTNIATDFTATLAVTGTYLLVISGNSGSSVPYSFVATDVSDPAETPTGFGMVQSGTIAAGQVASFSYTAPAGLAVALDAQVPAPSNLTITLLDPFNNVVFSPSASSDVGATVLPRGGTYTLRVQGNNASATGSYQFNLLDLAADSTPLVLGTAVSDSLAASTIRTYQFTGSAGERVFYDGLTGSGIGASLDGPSGNVFNVAINSQNGPSILPSAGTYTLTIYTSGGSGPYSFNLFNAAAPVVANYVLGTAENGTLANPGDQAIYTFSAAAGQRVFYNATVNSSGIDALLQSPSGVQVFNVNGSSQQGPYTLPETGTYTLVIYGGGNTTGPFGFNLRAPLAPVTANYVLGTPVNSMLANPGDQAIYTFSGGAGQRVFYNATVNSSGIDALLQSPSGVQVFNVNASSQQGPYTLPEAGTYTLVIYGSGNTTGAFGFNLRAPLAPVDPFYMLGTPVSSSLANPGDEALYTFSGGAGQRVFYNATVSSSGIDALLQSPSGSVIFNVNASSQQGPYVLPQAGTYTLLIYGSGSSTGAFGFNLRAPLAPVAPIAPGTAENGTLASPGDEAFYTFTGAAGERLTYDALIPSDGSLDVLVQTPSGALLINGNAFNDAGFTLPVAGTYTVIVYGSGAATGGYSFELERVDAAPRSHWEVRSPARSTPV
jgi:YD repeat-containing protein